MYFVEYDDEIYSDGHIAADVDDNADLQSLDISPQLNHLYIKANGDLENDLDTVNVMKQCGVPVSANAMQRQSSVDGAVVGPVNGLQTHEHNIIVQRMAVVEVKKPGKGRVFCRYKNIPRHFVCLEYVSK